MRIIVSKKHIQRIIKEEIKSSILEEGLKTKVGAAVTAIVTALMPLKASAHGNSPEVEPVDTTTSVRNISLSFQEVSGHENCYISDSVVNNFSRGEINSVFSDFESAKREIIEYFSNSSNIQKFIKLSSNADILNSDDEYLKNRYISNALRNLDIGFSELKFKVLSHDEMRREHSNAEGVFFPSRNEIHVHMDLVTRHSSDMIAIIKHELHHAASDYINQSLHFYKDKKSYEKYSPKYQDSESSVEREYDDYLKHPWENAAYSYAARKLFNLSINPSKKDIIDGFKDYGIQISSGEDGMYVIRVPPKGDINPGDLSVSLSYIISKMKEKIKPYVGPVGEEALTQTLSSIKPFIKEFKYDIDKDEYQLIFDLQEYTNMLNKTAKIEKPSKRITVEIKRKRIKNGKH